MPRSIQDSARRDFIANGYTVVPDAVGQAIVDTLIRSTADCFERSRGRGGVRHLMRDVPAARALAESEAMRGIAELALGFGAHPVRGILFDKNPDANWKVIWHQDLTIAVRERRDVPGFGPWSEKDLIPHVQPPLELLAQMVAVRLHLDDCTEENGPVRVIPGSHRAGRLSPDQITALRGQAAEVECTVGRGGVLAFFSLILHASSPARKPLHRRVLHIEYVASSWRELPGGPEWCEAS